MSLVHLPLRRGHPGADRPAGTPAVDPLAERRPCTRAAAVPREYQFRSGVLPRVPRANMRDARIPALYRKGTDVALRRDPNRVFSPGGSSAPGHRVVVWWRYVTHPPPVHDGCYRGLPVT